jgi:SagB-type dehydrogenase family enzyme
MQCFHDATKITLKKYYSEPHFIDWTTQPRSYKIYPHFYRRYALAEYPLLAFIENIGKVTYEKTYYNQTVSLRTNPSAGGLYPCEVYVQIRGINQVVSGIYHYEPLNNSLVLLHELSNDGLEYYFNDQTQYQFVFFISCVYFRSSWKYEKRAIRYLLLDVGHQLGSLHLALTLHNKEPLFEKECSFKHLNEVFGFNNEEFLMGCIKVNQYKENPPKALRQNLPTVQPCDYFIKEPFIETFYEAILKEEAFAFPFYEGANALNTLELQEAINQRRSIRAFKKESINKKEYLEICEDLFAFAQTHGIEIYAINNNIEGLEKGVYKNVSLQKKGNFEEMASTLALNQTLGKTSCATLFFTAQQEMPYAKTTQLCAYIAHFIYVNATRLSIGCSGIGAYFDEECQHFLQTQNNILYLLVLGK